MSNPGPNVVTSTKLLKTLESPDGVSLGKTSTSLAGMHGVAIAQAAGPSLVATTVSTTTNPYGFTTATQADALVASVNALTTALKNKGIIS